MEYRTLTESDAQAWWELRRVALEREPLSFGQSVEEHLALPLETVAQRFQQPHEKSFTFGAFHEGALVGMATFVREMSPKRRHKGNVYAVYVAPAHRGQGVAQTLLTHLVELARRDASLEQLDLAVTAVQPAAKRLYLSLGFETYGVEPQGLKVGKTYADQDHMALRLRR